MGHKLIIVLLLFSSNCFARLKTIELCSDIISKTEYIVLGKTKSDISSAKGNRIIKIEILNTYPSSDLQGAQLMIRDPGSKSIEGIPELNNQKLILFVRDFKLIKKEAKLVRSPYSIIVEGRFGTFVGPVNYSKDLFGSNVFEQNLELLGKNIEKNCSTVINNTKSKK